MSQRINLWVEKRLFWVRLIGILAVMTLFTVLYSNSRVQAEPTAKMVTDMASIYPSEWNVPYPEGIAYSAARQLFFLLEKNETEQAFGQSTIVVVTPFQDLVSSNLLNFNIGDAINMAFDDQAGRLFLLDIARHELVQLTIDKAGVLDPASETRFDVSRLGLQNPEGLSVDGRNNALLILDRGAGQLVRLDLNQPLARSNFTKIDLRSLGLRNLRGLAVNPESGNLVTMSSSKQLLYELDANYAIVDRYDLAGLGLRDSQGLTFAYTPDLTDDSRALQLFVADSNLPGAEAADEPDNDLALTLRSYLPLVFSLGDVEAAQDNDRQAWFGQVVALELGKDLRQESAAAAVNLVTLSLVQTVHTSSFNPPSPDPSGLVYIPSQGLIVESDAEVEEMPIYNNVNLFGTQLPNNHTFSAHTTRYTSEPAGIAFNEATGQWYVADDDQKRVYIIHPGNDGILSTSDDVKTHFLTTSFNCMDPEGIDYDPISNDLFIMDGLNRQVYRLDAGPNGVFNGVAPAGDDVVVNDFDTSTAAGGVGISGEPEGIDYDPSNGGSVLIAGGSTTLIYRVTTTGSVLQTYNISAAGATKIAGITLAPSSTTPGVTNYWLVDRGIDNNVNPDENDGKLYELTESSAATPTPTNTPVNVPPTATPTATPTAVSAALIYFGSTTTGSVGGVSYADEDVIVHDTSNGSYAMFWDGSDVGVTVELKGFERLSDNSLLLTFEDPVTIAGLGVVEEIDIVRFIPTSTGPNTAGSFQWYFDGSDVGLPPTIGAIDGLMLLSNGHLLLSGVNNGSPTGLASVQDEDIFEFTPTSLGENTAGTWSFYFDGSDIGLSDGDSEDITGVWVNPANGEIYLTTRGSFTVPGLTGDGDDVFICTPSSLGATTSCSNIRLFWNGGSFGFSQIMDTLGIVLTGAVAQTSAVSEAALAESSVAPLAELAPATDAALVEEDQDEAAADDPALPAQQIFLPIVWE